MDFNEEIKQLLLTGHRGCDIVRYHSRRMDEFVCRTVTPPCPPLRGGKDFPAPGRTCFGVFAIGGYGRGELAPHSDIDLMFLVRDRRDTSRIEDAYYRLLDSGIHISHCVRTPQECIEEGFKDVRTRTSLLDTRFLTGDTDLQQTFKDGVLTELLVKNQREFFALRLQEMSNRHKKFGASVYLLQPNVKDSAGGLRDVHEALWLSKIALNFKSMADFTQILSRRDYGRLLAAWDFLLKVRVALHLSTLHTSTRGSDVLSFNDQQTVATLLGIGDTRYFSASERLLRLYYIRAATIKTVTEKIRNIAGSMFVNLPRKTKRYRIDDMFSLSQNKIMLNDEQTFKKYPHKIIDAYLLSAKTGKGFTRYLTALIRKHSHLINKEVRSSQAAIRALMAVFKSTAPYAPLQMMFNDGVLGRLIPELAPLRLLVVSEPYHIYTVDAHTMLAIKTLQELGSATGDYDKVVSLIYNSFKDKEILYMAILFHDIGKALGRWHSTRGYMRIKPVLERLQLQKSHRDTVEFLVKNHLLLSRSSFTKDIDDHDTIVTLAEGIRDERLLNALLLVTYADMSAVNPGFFTDWRKSLVIGLYNGLLRHLRGVQQCIETYGGDDIMTFIDTMPKRYIKTTVPQKVRQEFELLRALKTHGFALSVEHRIGNTTELTVLAMDRGGLLRDIVGVLSLRALNILSLRTFVSTEGYVIDRLRLSNYKELWWEGMDELIETELKRVCTPTTQEDTITPHMIVRKYPHKDNRISPFLEVDNESSIKYTVFETISTDRIGLLYDMVSVFSKNSLDIMMARVNTEMEIAHDVFFVTSAATTKQSVDTETLPGLMGQLWEALN
ncbi:UTP-GlnB uridylyltransferase, GlnD [Candidatus Magnetobacterium bavaricum]|uniref:Bifunctional uridylyltransferase/uridylyl-removing enzyme n=1 Tax=Candidatus Magnetobacterium bavaricum TaxID=29290 RepID=A0A0F3GQ82_9BACT|nr:UTP-GlnB uridylyltransferase, GlnD [Candidatus Magnetobacterium bavaricum]